MPIFRAALRLAAQAALQAAAVVAIGKVFVEYDWPSADAALPAISISTPRWHHDDRTNGAGGPQFWSVVNLLIEYRAQAISRAALVDLCDGAADQIESAIAGLLVGPPQLGFRRIVRIEGDLALDSQGERHEGALNLSCLLEYANDAEPAIADRLERVTAVMVRRFAAGDSDVNAPVTNILAGADFQIND